MTSGNAGPPVFMAAPQPPKRQSLWLLWVYLGCGTISWIGFAVVAVKVRTRKFVRAAVVAAVLSGIGYAAYAIWPPADVVLQESDPDASVDLSSYNGLLVLAALWILLIIYGHILNHDYKKFLRTKDDQDRQRLNSLRVQAPTFYPQPATKPSAPSAPPVDHLTVQADKYLATQPTGNTPARVPPNGPWG